MQPGRAAVMEEWPGLCSGAPGAWEGLEAACPAGSEPCAQLKVLSLGQAPAIGSVLAYLCDG